MSTVLWYWPTDGIKALSVDLGSMVMDREGPSPTLYGTHVESITGSVVSTHYGGRWGVRYRHIWDTRGSGTAKRRQLFALVNHLQRGGTCMVAEDSTYAFAAFATVLPDRNSTRISIGANVFESLAPNVSVNGRDLVIQSDPDAFIAEMRLCSAHSGATLGAYVDLSTDCAFAYANEAKWVLVREYGSWPALRLPPAERSSPILTHRHEQVYELDLPLEEAPDTLEELQQAAVSSTTAGVEPMPDLGSAGLSVGSVKNGWVW